MVKPLEEENDPKFFVDAMLGNIAKKLRLMGYDTRYEANIEDARLVELAVKDHRIIISRDDNLVRKALKLGIKSIFLGNKEEIKQIREIINKLNLKSVQINGDKARCTKCNSKTNLVDKKNLNNKLPIRILEFNEKFWECKSCDKIFWEGTHIKNLQKLVGELNGSLQDY